MDNDQLYWYRRKVATNGLELTRQEYPCTADEAFITSGRPVFVSETIHEMLEKAQPPIKRMAVDEFYSEKTKRVECRVVDHPQGELFIYHERDDGGQYWIGADVSVGIRDVESGDWCVAQILDSRMRQVAVWRGQVTPDHYARVLAALGEYYNMALVAPERNGHGILVCVRLFKDINYPNVFTHIKEGGMADKETLEIGFQTNVGSRPLIIDKLRGYVRERTIEI